MKELKTGIGSNETYIKFTGSNLSKCILTKGYTDDQITENDTFNVTGLSDQEIVEMIKQKININIRTEKGIRLINEYFQISVDFLHDRLYKKHGNEINQNKDFFFSLDKDKTGKLGNDVIGFLRETEKGIKKSQTHCRISKTIFSVNNILENPIITESESKARDILLSKITPGIQVDDIEQLLEYNHSNCHILLHGKIINFTLKFRGKKSSSALMKIIYNPEYHGSELIQDPIGMELVCNTQSEAGILLDHFYTKLFNEEINEVKNKGFRIGSLLNNKIIQDSFKKELLKVHSKRKAVTNKGYNDLKILGNIEGCNIEFRASLFGNKKENSLLSDPIYNLSKVLHTMIRLDGYITENYIRIVINNFYKENPEYSDKIKNTDLLEYLKKSLTQIDRGKKCNIYTSKERFERLNKTDIYPKGFIEKK